MSKQEGDPSPRSRVSDWRITSEPGGDSTPISITDEDSPRGGDGVTVGRMQDSEDPEMRGPVPCLRMDRVYWLFAF